MGARITNVAYSLERRQVEYTSTVVTTTSGTIGSQTGAKGAGFTVEKTAGEAGRYTLTLGNRGASFRGVNVAIIGADDAAYTGGKGLWCGLVRDNDMATGANDGTIEIQLQVTSGPAPIDAEVEDGATLVITLRTAE